MQKMGNAVSSFWTLKRKIKFQLLQNAKSNNAKNHRFTVTQKYPIFPAHSAKEQTMAQKNTPQKTSKKNPKRRKLDKQNELSEAKK